MKKLKKILALSLCGLMAFSAVGCNPVDDDGEDFGNATVIKIEGYEAGVNLDWIRELGRQYSALHKDDVYEEGKQGVAFDIDPVSKTNTGGILGSDYHIFVTHGGGGEYTARTLANQYATMSIDAVVNPENTPENAENYEKYTEVKYDAEGNEYRVTIKDKINAGYYDEMLCTNDGKCYGLPSYGIKTGLSFDAYNFRKYGLFLVDEAWAKSEGLGNGLCRKIETTFGTRYFTNDKASGLDLEDGVKLSCGNDGVYGTWDDGHPSSYEELLILCEHMKENHSIYPLTTYGKGPSRRTEMVGNLWTSLGGYAEAQSQYTYESAYPEDIGTDLNKYQEVEVVDFDNNDGFSSEIAFPTTDKTRPNVDGIKKPYTKMVKISNINSLNGYLSGSTAARYYGIAFTQIAYEMGWYSPLAADEGMTHLGAERRFVLNGMKVGGETYPLCGMLIEGDYWYNESKKDGAMASFKQYSEYYPKVKGGISEPDILWMSLPTQVYGTVQPNVDDLGVPYDAANGNVPASAYNEHVEPMNAGAPIVVNKRWENSPLKDLILDFLYFCHTDEALSFYTGNQGVYRSAMNYDVKEKDMANLSGFQKSSVAAFLTCQHRIAPVKGNFYNHEINKYNKNSFDQYQQYANNASLTAAVLFKGSKTSSEGWAQAFGPKA